MSGLTLAELTYEQAQKALEQQERQVNELRQRTGTLLGAAALAASFFGAAALGRDGVWHPDCPGRDRHRIRPEADSSGPGEGRKGVGGTSGARHSRLWWNAANVGGTTLRSLDAIHLASARSIQAELSAFIAYDHRLAEAASTVGLEQLAPGA